MVNAGASSNKVSDIPVPVRYGIGTVLEIFNSALVSNPTFPPTNGTAEGFCRDCVRSRHATHCRVCADKN